MPACIEELQSRGLSYPVLIGGAAINRAFGYRALYPGGPDSQDAYEAGVFYCKDAFEGLAVMDQLIDEQARGALVEKLQTAAREFRERPVELDTSPPSTDDSVRSGARTDAPVPEPPFWGVREIPVDLAEVYPHLDTHVLFKLHWGGRGKKGEEWQALLRDDFRPRLERMWARADLPAPAGPARLLPLLRTRQRHRRARPRGPHHRAHPPGVSAPGGRRADLPGRLLPPRRRRARLPRSSTSSRCRRSPSAARSPSCSRVWRPTANTPSSCSSTGSGCRPPRRWPSGCTARPGACSGSPPPRDGATRGATRRSPSRAST